MIPDGLLHDQENNELSQNHLKQNGKKFSKQCQIVMQLLYSGKKLNGMIIEREYHMNSRRLRDCYQGRPDVVKRKWISDKEGNSQFVEYWIDVLRPPTKGKLITMYQGLLVQKEIEF